MYAPAAIANDDENIFEADTIAVIGDALLHISMVTADDAPEPLVTLSEARVPTMFQINGTLNVTAGV